MFCASFFIKKKNRAKTVFSFPHHGIVVVVVVVVVNVGDDAVA